LENGAVAVENEAKSLLNDPRVIESYLGLGGSHSIAA
jgi:ABC-type branched-subunit amino acid transport system ATPase component